MTLLLPVALLPLLALRQLAPALPWLLLVFLAVTPEETRRAALVAPVLPFLFVATAQGLHKLGRPTHDRMSVNPRTSGHAAGHHRGVLHRLGPHLALRHAVVVGWSGRPDQARLGRGPTWWQPAQGRPRPPGWPCSWPSGGCCAPSSTAGAVAADVDIVLVDEVVVATVGALRPTSLVGVVGVGTHLGVVPPACAR